MHVYVRTYSLEHWICVRCKGTHEIIRRKLLMKQFEMGVCLFLDVRFILFCGNNGKLAHPVCECGRGVLLKPSTFSLWSSTSIDCFRRSRIARDLALYKWMCGVSWRKESTCSFFSSQRLEYVVARELSEDLSAMTLHELMCSCKWGFFDKCFK